MSDTATWARGAHLVKFGGEWYGVRQSAYRDVQSRGFLTFVNQGYTGNALADLLIGLPVVTGGARLDNPQNLRAQQLEPVRARRLAGDARADDLRGRALRVRVAAGRRGRSREPLRSGDRAARARRHRRHAARRLRARSQQHRAARRASPGPWTPKPRRILRGGYGIYYNQGAAGHVRRAVLQPSVLQPERLLSGVGPVDHARRSVPGVVPGVHSAVGDRVPAGPADAVDGALERQRAAPDRAEPGDRESPTSAPAATI